MSALEYVLVLRLLKVACVLVQSSLLCVRESMDWASEYSCTCRTHLRQPCIVSRCIMDEPDVDEDVVIRILG